MANRLIFSMAFKLKTYDKIYMVDLHRKNGIKNINFIIGLKFKGHWKFRRFAINVYHTRFSIFQLILGDLKAFPLIL